MDMHGKLGIFSYIPQI